MRTVIKASVADTEWQRMASNSVGPQIEQYSIDDHAQGRGGVALAENSDTMVDVALQLAES